MSRSGIYQVLCKSTGHRYIGSAENIEARWAGHHRSLAKGKHPNKALQYAWATFGPNDFEWTVLEVVPGDALEEREQHYMDTLSPELNIAKKTAGRSKSKGRTRVTTIRLKDKTTELLKKHSYFSRRSQTDIMNEALEEWFQRNGFSESLELHVTKSYATLLKRDVDKPPQVMEVQERNGLSPAQMADKLAAKYQVPVTLVLEKYEEESHEQRP